MFKLLKKLMLVGIVAGATVVAVKSTKVGHTARHEMEEVVAWAETQVPVQKKIDRLRRDVRFLDKDIDKAASSLAREIVEVRLKTEEVAAQHAALDKSRVALQARGKSIADSLKVGATEGRTPAPDAKDRLKLDVTRFKDRERQVAAEEKMLELKEKNKASLEAQLTTLKTKKLELETAIGQAETKFKELQLAQMENKFQADDTRLSRIKAALRELNKDLDVEAEKLKLAPTVHEEAPATPAADTQSVEDILAPLAGK